MRSPVVAVAVAVVVACARPARAPGGGAADAAGAARAAARAVAAGELPRVFAEARAEDVDDDGVIDRVREVPLLPRQSPDATLPAPALVAHGLGGGRFALDDDVTRAALRTVCPDDPPLSLRPAPDEGPARRAERLNELLLDAWCQQAWGRDLADITAGLRALQRSVGADALGPDHLDAIAQVLRETAPPITLRPLRAASLPAFAARGDGDGGVDDSPWHVVSACGGGVLTGPRRASRAALLGRCAAAAREGVAAGDAVARDLLAVVCARAAGADAESVVAGLRARYRAAPRLGHGEGCVAFPDLARNALVAP